MVTNVTGPQCLVRQSDNQFVSFTLIHVTLFNIMYRIVYRCCLRPGGPFFIYGIVLKATFEF